ncbi:homogentisate phytyltransferase [Microcoleus sp. FACHB-1515]|uniref:homogentisate phytyltransferase n=1 Tax=Cyanophyceae TaxID=3028117 RepID=UPI00168720D4|nr:homogentisate phytyltransferase [Microcoleus sp. FACHB-1515]MBD2089705.1 homogentisate phytyltransferase [Microcoleus sp. FACHB-1515]
MSQISPEKPSVSSQPATALSWLYAFWKFSRPHTIIGTTLSAIGLFVIALSQIDRFALSDLQLVLWVLIACLSGNVYIVGLNQLEDVAIDRINKPQLPLASGELTRRQAQSIVALTGILAVAIAVWQGPWLLATIGLSLIIGTAYSLPPIRLKRFPFWASFCIFTVRGAIVNLGLFLHYQQRFGLPAQVPAIVWALTAFILVYTFAIAIFKDIPDLEGDRRYHIRTLTIRLGQQAVFKLARWVLTLCYVGMIAAALFWPAIATEANAIGLVVSHAVAIGLLWFYSLRVDLANKHVTGTLSYAQFYQLIWRFFFLEYLLFPIACLLR